MTNTKLVQQLLEHLQKIYDQTIAPELIKRINALIALHIGQRNDRQASGALWDEKTNILITYGDSVQYPGVEPLPSLKQFLDQRLRGVFNLVHLLPFYPLST